MSAVAESFCLISDPLSQRQKFDPDCDNLQHWKGEIVSLPDQELLSPWKAAAHFPPEQTGFLLGTIYPGPVPGSGQSRNDALKDLLSPGQAKP